jgi:prolyl oligopeptidase
MVRRVTRLLAALLFAACLLPLHGAEPPKVPTTAKKPVTDEYHGTKVVDDYRWLEKGDDPGVQRWVRDQNEYARGVLDALPGREAIAARLEALYRNARPNYSELHPLEDGVLALSGGSLMRLASVDKPETRKVLVDPEKVLGNGTATINYWVPSPDGKRVAVSLSADGKDQGTVFVFDSKDGTQLEDEVPRAYSPLGGSLAWKGDGSGFYYVRHTPVADRPKDGSPVPQQIYFHELGKPAKEDAYVFGKDFSPISGVTMETSPDGKYLVASVSTGWTSDQFSHYLLGPDGKWVRVTTPADQVMMLTFGENDDLLLLSRLKAPRGQILRMPLDKPVLKDAQVVAAETKGVISGLAPQGERVYVMDRLDGSARVLAYDLKGKELKPLPVKPSHNVVQVVPVKDDEVLVQTESLLEPPTWFRVDPGTLKSTRLPISAAYPGASFADFEVVRVEATSKDGTKVPLDLLKRKKVELDGKNPTLLTGYGGYGEAQAPDFLAVRRVWLEQGGIWAIAHVRGDGEYGEDWHKAGLVTKKQNGFDDFYACAQYLIDQKYTSPERLAIEGASNGGTLMGVALTQRPKLFKAVVSHVGNYDMLRQETQASGAYDVPEFGTVKVKEQFQALHAYSPYHHVEDNVAYPAVLLVSGENDGRVDPADSRKLAARLQAATSSKEPVLLWTRMGSGHSCVTFEEELDLQADVYAFLFKELGVEYKAPK